MTDFRLGVDFDPPDADQRRMVLLEQEGAPGIAVLGHSQFRRHSPSADEHTHEGCLEIVLCQRGALTFQNGARRHSLMPGDLLINRPGERHRLLTYPKGLSLYWMLVRVAPAASPLLMLPPVERRTLRDALLALPPSVLHDDGTIRLAFARLFAYLSSPPGELRALGLVGTSLHLLLAVLQAPPRPKPSRVTDRLERTIAQIRQNPARDYSIDELARQAALSPSRFISRFKQITGMPPRHYLLDCRLERAKDALARTRVPVTRLALELGFDSSQHFANTFKRATGHTPTQWRQEHASGVPLG